MAKQQQIVARMVAEQARSRTVTNAAAIKASTDARPNSNREQRRIGACANAQPNSNVLSQRVGARANARPNSDGLLHFYWEEKLVAPLISAPNGECANEMTKDRATKLDYRLCVYL
jgi:hypothetical protein